MSCQPDNEGLEGPSYIFNPNKKLSLYQQRTRLPISKYRDDILYLLEQYQTLVIHGETGSGKSTQIPQFFMETGWTDTNKMMAVTQPRKVAVISLASRVAEEVGCQVGDKIGFTVRFQDESTEKTHIKYMTEGILVKEMMSDPLLERYSVVMVDEVHERTVNTDILLGLLKRILLKRPDLKLIVASATIDAELFLKFFDLKYDKTDKERPRHTSAILSVEGSCHPIDVHYIREPVANYVKASVNAVIALHETERTGDVLVFLTGQDEVQEAVSLLLDYSRSQTNPDMKKMYVLPLHGSLPSKEQFKIFESFPKSVRKVIVSTNIAETSVTIPGISYVVDSGFMKIRYFNPKTCSDSLVICPVSKASAKQRAGRAGRMNPGKVFRLYREKDYDLLEKFTVPEIQRTSLAGVILQLKALGVKNVYDFNFPARPPEVNFMAGLELLFALDAIDDDGELTSFGLKMAELPLEPMLSKALLDSEKFECSQEVLSIVSMLSVENIFQTPSSGQASIQANNAKYNKSVEEGDLITFLNLYNEFMAEGRIRSWADKNFLNYNALLRVCDVRSKLSDMITKRFGIKLLSAEGDIESIEKCLLTGLFCNAVFLDPTKGERVYKTVRGSHLLYIHPSSVLNVVKRPPRCLVFAQVLHTTQDFMRNLMAIDPKWLTQVAPKYFEFGTERELREQD